MPREGSARAATLTDTAPRHRTAASWFGELVASLPQLEVYGLPILIVDLGTGRFLGASPSARDVLGIEVPATIHDLVEAGFVARPDLDRLVRHVDAWRALDDLENDGTDSAHGWHDEVRVHRPGAGPAVLELEIAVHRRPSLPADAAIVSCWRRGADRPLGPYRSPDALGEVWAIYDHELRMVAVDPRLADLEIDPRSQLGTVAWMYTHPEDLPHSIPQAAAVVAGERRTATYSLRLRAKDGRWLPADIEVRRMETDVEPLIVVIARYVNDTRHTIEPGVLSAREAQMVAGLFEGLRVSQIAERHRLAVKTVRNHLASAYAKLGVEGQLDLVARYHPPDRGPT